MDRRYAADRIGGGSSDLSDSASSAAEPPASDSAVEPVASDLGSRSARQVPTKHGPQRRHQVNSQSHLLVGARLPSIDLLRGGATLTLLIGLLVRPAD